MEREPQDQQEDLIEEPIPHDPREGHPGFQGHIVGLQSLVLQGAPECSLSSPHIESVLSTSALGAGGQGLGRTAVLPSTFWGQGQQEFQVPTYSLRAQQLSDLSPLFLCGLSQCIGWLRQGRSMFHGPQLQPDGLQFLLANPQ